MPLRPLYLYEPLMQTLTLPSIVQKKHGKRPEYRHYLCFWNKSQRTTGNEATGSSEQLNLHQHDKTFLKQLKLSFI